MQESEVSVGSSSPNWHPVVNKTDPAQNSSGEDSPREERMEQDKGPGSAWPGTRVTAEVLWSAVLQAAAQSDLQ